MLPCSITINQVFQKHKNTWSDFEKRLVHEKLNQHGITDGIDHQDQAIAEVMMMIYTDGIRKGSELR